MSQPLAVVFYERLMPGSQLVNRLQDLNYRVLAINNAALLAASILGGYHPAFRDALKRFRAARTQSVLDKPDPRS